jgi:hypothetical protein
MNRVRQSTYTVATTPQLPQQPVQTSETPVQTPVFMGMGGKKKDKGRGGKSDDKPDYDDQYPEKSVQRRAEPDKFTIFLKYMEKKKQFVWFAYRSADPEMSVKNNKKVAGVAYLWGDFYPAVENIAEGYYEAKTSAVNYQDRFTFRFIKLNLGCSNGNHGYIVLRGTCDGRGTWINIQNVKKKVQDYDYVLTYNPDSSVVENISSYMEGQDISEIFGKSSSKQDNVYNTCKDAFCIDTNEDVVDKYGLDLICDFSTSFSDALEKEPRMKMKFDDIPTTCLDINECDPYLSPSTLQKWKTIRPEQKLHSIPDIISDNTEHKTLDGKKCRSIVFGEDDDLFLDKEAEERMWFFGGDSPKKNKISYPLRSARIENEIFDYDQALKLLGYDEKELATSKLRQIMRERQLKKHARD